MYPLSLIETYEMFKLATLLEMTLGETVALSILVDWDPVQCSPCVSVLGQNTEPWIASDVASSGGGG